ncbi:MAG: large conductance mechanosensitive channel protein MscL [Christensenellaceae bacterium]
MDKKSKEHLKEAVEKPKKLVSEFKKFVFKGNFAEVIIGVVVATAFTVVIRSLLNDLLMPFVGFLLGDVNFSSLTAVIVPASEFTKGLSINYGLFLQNCLDFLVLAILIFIIFKIWAKIQSKKNIQPEETEEIKLLKEIKELLVTDKELAAAVLKKQEDKHVKG